MKRAAILLIVLETVSVSCKSRIDYKSGEPEEMLVLSSNMRTDDTTHLAFLGISKLRESYIITPEDGTIDCYVNGKYVSTSEHVYVSPEEYMEHQESGKDVSGWYFDAVLHEGDEIRLEATCGELHASATVTVPRAAGLSLTDTLTVTGSPYDENAKAFRCTVSLKDRPGEENRFRLLAIDSYSVAREHGLLHALSHATSFRFDDDVVLRGDFHSSRERAAVNETALDIPLVTNKYCIFTDRDFRDSEHTAELFFYWGPVQSSRWLHEVHTIHNSKIIKLLTLSEDEYDYLLAFTNAEANRLLSNNTSTQIFFEPVIFPGNVEGGLGLVTVAAVACVRIDFPDIYYDALPD